MFSILSGGKGRRDGGEGEKGGREGEKKKRFSWRSHPLVPGLPHLAPKLDPGGKERSTSPMGHYQTRPHCGEDPLGIGLVNRSMNTAQHQ